MSEFIGVVRDVETGAVLMVINPDDDSELDNPRWLLLKATGRTSAMEMVKVPRGEYMGAMTTEQLATLIEGLKK
jgi:hypothetical protein